MFDQDLYIEHGDRRFGPFTPSRRADPASQISEVTRKQGGRTRRPGGGPRRSDWSAQGGPRRRRASIGTLRDGARQTPLHRSRTRSNAGLSQPLRRQAAVADEIGMALAKVSVEDRAFIDALLRETLAKDTVLARVRAHFKNRTAGGG